MKKILLAIAVVFAGIKISAQTSGSADPNAPVISFETEVIDFGTVQQGSEQVRTFKITNTGKTPLVISGIKGQCGCTTFPDNYPKDPIPPGGSATFKVKYDTSVRVGMFDKKVMVYSNASNNLAGGYVEVKIKGNVVSAGVSTSGGN
ncbi:MAG: DUF1573 domain-containing protein [Bacteroidetes bacterium]|nr:DUF1573 domain-containing protein [Bacteroidota bacterium]